MTADRDPAARSRLEARLARVERALDAVSREVTAIRAELGTETVVVEAVVANVASPAIPTRTTSSWPRVGDDLDLERLLGRYGMLGIAVLAGGSPRIRQLGLALALLAAITAVVGATSYFDIGARVLAYLVTSAFLLGIAYWYRRPGTAASAETG